MQFKQSLSLLLVGVLPLLAPQQTRAGGRPSCASPNLTQSYAAPTQYAAPVTQYAAPVTTQYATPVIMQQAAPVAMQYTPVVTQYAAPIATQYAAPMVTQYAAPVATQYAAPVGVHVAPITTQYATPLVAQYATPVSTQYQTLVTHPTVPSVPAYSTATRPVYQQASTVTVNQQAIPLLSLLLGGLNLASNLDPSSRDQQILGEISVALQDLQNTISTRNPPSNPPAGQRDLANRISSIEDYLTAQAGSNFKSPPSTSTSNQSPQNPVGPSSLSFTGARSGTPAPQPSAPQPPAATGAATSDLSTKVSDLTAEIKALTAAVKDLTEKLPAK